MPRQKYEQIYSILKGQIEAGDYPVGGLLPSENVLIGEFQCSRNTVRRALANLVRDGRAGGCATSTSLLRPPPTPWAPSNPSRRPPAAPVRTAPPGWCCLPPAPPTRPCPAAPAFPRAPNSSISSGSTIEGDRPGLHLPLSGAGGPYVHCHQQAHHHRGDGG